MDVKVFKALADEKRLEILEQIISDECCVDKACACEMIKTLDITQPTLSHHVKILSDGPSGYCSFSTHQENPFLYLSECKEFNSGEYELIIK